MKNSILIAVTIFSLIFSTTVQAECDPAKDIRKLDAQTYAYSVGCHIFVGETIEELGRLKTQNKSLYASIDFYQQALAKSEQRTQLWMDTTFKTQDQLNKFQSASELDGWVKFGLGVGVTVLSVWASGQLRP